MRGDYQSPAVSAAASAFGASNFIFLLHTGYFDQAADFMPFRSPSKSSFTLNNVPTYPLGRPNRYEATLWRQACQILFMLQCLGRRNPWDQLRFR
jgi:hypothetical protein